MESRTPGTSMRALNAALTQVAALLEWEEEPTIPGVTQLRDDVVRSLNRHLPKLLKAAVVRDSAKAAIGRAVFYIVSPRVGTQMAEMVAEELGKKAALATFDLEVLRAGFYLLGVLPAERTAKWKIGSNLYVVPDDLIARSTWTRIQRTFGVKPKTAIP